MVTWKRWEHVVRIFWFGQPVSTLEEPYSMFPKQRIRWRVLYIVSRQVSGSQAPKSVAPTVALQTVAAQTVAAHQKSIKIIQNQSKIITNESKSIKIY